MITLMLTLILWKQTQEMTQILFIKLLFQDSYHVQKNSMYLKLKECNDSLNSRFDDTIHDIDFTIWFSCDFQNEI